jgi:hypothetical protein
MGVVANDGALRTEMRLEPMEQAEEYDMSNDTADCQRGPGEYRQCRSAAGPT